LPEELHLVGSVAEHFAGKNMRKGIGKPAVVSLKLFNLTSISSPTPIFGFLKIHCVLFRRDINANHFLQPKRLRILR
jgi:hypothetical protein